jgi:creatinine amidohydrolase
MTLRLDHRREVRYDFMLGREINQAIAACPVAYLPIGCLERHGDHLPMGLDAAKAHGLCCLAAQAIGGVVLPAHPYAGIHRMTEAELEHYTGAWGNIYTDATAAAHLTDIIRQLARLPLRVLVLYSGHYPACQVDLCDQVAAALPGSSLSVYPFCECRLFSGDHAGFTETSLMLYLDRSQVDLTRIGPENWRDHGWSEANSPARASAAAGEELASQIVAHLQEEVARRLSPPVGAPAAAE